jgi:hypothetical protein
MNRTEFLRTTCPAGSLRLAVECFGAPPGKRERCARLPDASPPTDAFAWFNLLARRAPAGCVTLSADQCQRYALHIFVAAAAAAAVHRSLPRFHGDSPLGDAHLRAVAMSAGMELGQLAGRSVEALQRILETSWRAPGRGADGRAPKRARGEADARPADPFVGAMHDAHRSVATALREAERTIDTFGRGPRNHGTDAVLEHALKGYVRTANEALALMAQRWVSARTVHAHTAAEWDAARLQRGRAERAAARLYALVSSIRAALRRSAAAAAPDAVDIQAIFELLLDTDRNFPVLVDRAEAVSRWHARGPGALIQHLRAREDGWRIKRDERTASQLRNEEPIWFGSTVITYAEFKDEANTAGVYYQADRFGRNPAEEALFPRAIIEADPADSTEPWTRDQYEASTDIAVAGPVRIGFDNSALSHDFVMLPPEHCATVTVVTIPRIDLRLERHRDGFVFTNTGRLDTERLKRRMKRMAKLFLYAFAQEGVTCPVLCPVMCEAWEHRPAQVPELWAKAVAKCLEENDYGFRMVVISLANEHGMEIDAQRRENEAAVERVFGVFAAVPVVVARWPGAVTIARILALQEFHTGILNPCSAATVRGGHVGARWEGPERTASEDALGTQTTLVLHHRTLNPELYTDPNRRHPFPPLGWLRGRT